MQDALISELGILKEASQIGESRGLDSCLASLPQVDHPFIVKFVRSFRNELLVGFSQFT